jgi:hypothetical protein
LNILDQDFFWQNDEHKKKYRLAKWNILCQPKEQGGIGIQNLDLQNKCLLSKWLFKLCNEEGTWQELIRNKYLQNKTLSQSESNNLFSHFWSSLLGVKDIFLSLGKFKLDNGTQIRFWEDKWLDSQPLKIQYPNLFNIVRKKQATLANVLNSTSLNVSFRRTLVGNKLLEWQSLVARVSFINLNEGRDTFVWNLNNNGLFSVKSMYKYLVNNGIKVT